jgi:hypothetical protein
MSLGLLLIGFALVTLVLLWALARTRPRSRRPSVKSQLAAPAAYAGPGRYRHYKGSEYEVLGLALHESQLGRLVIYRPVSAAALTEGSAVDFWARPEADFIATVRRPEGPVARFTFLGPVS